MRKFTLISCWVFCILINQGIAQNEARIWYFGNGLGLDFSSATPSLLTNGSTATSLGCAGVCSSSGSLLFYTDGVTVWNQTHSVMANGTGLFGDPGAQTCVIVKKPLSPNLYYVFTVQGGGGSAGLCYSIVDMALAGGNGSVTAKNVPLHSTPCEEKISATKHCNQTDAWVMVHEMNTQNFQAFALTASGIGTMVTSSFSPQPFPITTISTHTGYSPRGTMKFSPNGRKLAEVFTVSSATTPIGNGGVASAVFEICDFNNSSGLLSNIQIASGFGPGFSILSWAYGTEFSPDGTKLYFTTTAGMVAQINHCVFPSTSTWGIPFTGDSPPVNSRAASLQLGPDGKIYVAVAGSNSIGVINNPNLPTPSCNYVPGAISLGTAVCGLGLPNFYTPYFENTSQTFTAAQIPGSDCRNYNFFVPIKCAVAPNNPNSQIPFSGYIINNYSWNFGDPLSGSANTSTISSPSHYFSAAGSYTVQLVLSYLCGRNDTLRQTLVVPNTATISVVTPSLSCGFASATVIPSGALGPCSYTWQPTNINNAVANNLSPGVYTVFTKDAGTGCSYITTLSIGPTVISSSVNAAAACAGVNTGTALVLTSGGSGSYTYSWTGTSSTSTLVGGLPLGTNSVIISDLANNCVLTSTFQINQSPPLLFNISANINNALCTGNSLVLSGICTGGAPPYAYSWIGGSNTSSIAITHNLSGSYTYTCNVLDALNCSASKTYQVIYIQTPTLAASNVSLCSGQSATLVASGASTYYWLPVNTNANPCVINPSVSGTYTLIGNTGPCGTTKTISVIVTPAPILTLTSNAPVCSGGLLSLFGNGSAVYSWLGPLGFSSPLQNATISPIALAAGGIYSLTGTGASGCASTSTLSITVLPSPLSQITGNTNLCAGQLLSLSSATAAQYNWSGPLGFSATTQSILLNGLITNQSGVYSISITATNLCAAASSVSVQVNSNPTIMISGPNMLCLGQQATLTASGGSTYFWNNGGNTSTLIITPNFSTVYTATGTLNGCTSVSQFKIGVSDCVGLNEELPELNMSYFPNPTKTNLTLICELPMDVLLFDARGRIVVSCHLEKGRQLIAMEHLASGIYFLNARAGAYQQKHFKIVKED